MPAPRLALAILIGAAGGFVPAAPEVAPAPRPVVGRALEDPPPEVAALLKQARTGTPKERTLAAVVLGKLPEAEPYLRLAVLVADADTKPHLRAALKESQAAIDARNIKRARTWVEDGRVDLIAEAVCLARSDDAADALAEFLRTFATGCAARAGKLLKKGDGTFARLGPKWDFEDLRAALRYDTDKVVMDRSQAALRSFVRTGKLVSAGGLTDSIAVVRDSWSATGHINKSDKALIFLNHGDVQLGDLRRCLVVVDGDVTKWEVPVGTWADASGSVVLVRGSVGGPAYIGGAEPGCLWAGGDVTLELKARFLTGWGIFAGGTLPVEPGMGEAAVVKAGTKENPFGVRFFELKELGVEVEDHPDGVRIKRLTVDSPFARQGLCPGDVVSRVNDTATDSAKEFRRELRRAVVWEAGVFWLTRDGTRLTRVVRFPDGLP